VLQYKLNLITKIGLLFGIYLNILTCSTEAAKESLIYSYGRSFNGFAAKLSDQEVARFSGDRSIEIIN